MRLSFLDRILRRKAHKKKGQSLIVVALAMLMIFAILALTLNIQQLTSTRATIQTAADSAALAGANIQAQGKELIKVCEILRFLRDEVVALFESVYEIVRDISYIFYGIGIMADAASPFCFCAGTWAFPIAVEVGDVADNIKQVSDAISEATQPFYDALGTAEGVIAEVTPFIAVVNAYEYGHINNAAFTIPLPMPQGNAGNDPLKIKDDPAYNAILGQINSLNTEILKLKTTDIPNAERVVLADLKTYDVLALTVNRHDTARLVEAINEYNQNDDKGNPVCQSGNPPDPSCPELAAEIAAATAQRDSATPDDTEALQKAKDDFHNAGCDAPQNPPPASTCDPLQKAIDDAQKQLTKDTKARDAAAVFSGGTLTGGQAAADQGNVEQLKTKEGVDECSLDGRDDKCNFYGRPDGEAGLQGKLNDARNIRDQKTAAELNSRDVSFGRSGMEGTLVVVIKKGQPPITNFGGGDPGQTWAAAFGLTTSTSDPAKIYGHANISLLDAFSKGDPSSGNALQDGLNSMKGIAGQLAGAVLQLMISLSEQIADVENAIKEAVNKMCLGASVCGDILGLLPAFDLVQPDMHDVRPELVKFDAGFISSTARVNTDDAYNSENDIPKILETASDILQKWQSLASLTGLPSIGAVNFVQQEFGDDALF